MRKRFQAEQTLADDTRLLCVWRRWHQEELEEALAGPHGDVVAQLVQILRKLSLQFASTLLEFVRAQDWQSINYDVRLTLLHEVNNQLREQNNMPPFADLLDEGSNVFGVIRAAVLS